MSSPPKILLLLLEFLCPSNRPDLKGDFLELYEIRVETSGRRKANWQFLKDIVTVIPFKLLVKKSYQPTINMFSTNLKIARRNLVKNKLYTFINVAGLSVSLAACILIALFVRDELSYDKHFADSENIYRIAGNYDHGNGVVPAAPTTFLLLPMLEGNIPGIEKMTRLESRWETIEIDPTHKYVESSIVFADSTFFDIFNFTFILGDGATVLDDPSSVVIDEPTAEKYFGDANAMGKVVKLHDKLFKVGAVIKALPPNTHFRASVIFPITGVKQWYQDWVTTNPGGLSVYTYVKAATGFRAPEAEKIINKIFAKVWFNDQPPTFFLQPIPSIHLRSSLHGELSENGSINTVYIFSAIALIILLLACINYINLSIAGALQRFKEVGMMRVLGSTSRMQLFQFQTESFMVVAISVSLAVVIAFAATPVFNDVSGKDLRLNLISDPTLAVITFAVVVFISVAAGGFPAAMLHRLKTISMLTGVLTLKGSKAGFRNSLVIFQFSIAIALIASTMVVTSQMNFIRHKDLGMNPDNVVIMPMQTEEMDADKARDWYEFMRTELLRDPRVKGVSASSTKVTNQVGGWREYKVTWQKDNVAVSTTCVSVDFFETMGVKFLKGRPFSRDFPGDAKNSFIVNEAAATYLRLPDPVGAELTGASFTGDKWFTKDARIVGVVSDVQLGSLHTKPGPIVFNLGSEITERYIWMEIRLSGEDISGSLAYLENTWNKLRTDKPFQFEFMDQSLALNYESEQRFLKLFITFSTLSILIGCLGLFGLTAFMTKRRTKEIGIRKIVGASTPRLIGILSKDFLKLVLISNVIGWPVAYYLMNSWLENFAYRTEMSPWLFVLTGMVAVAIAFAAILYHALQASRANPVKALKYE